MNARLSYRERKIRRRSFWRLLTVVGAGLVLAGAMAVELGALLD